MHLKNVPTMRSTFEPWLLILLSASLIVIMWETAKNLWLNWGTTNFWVSSLVAALVGVCVVGNRCDSISFSASQNEGAQRQFPRFYQAAILPAIELSGASSSRATSTATTCPTVVTANYVWRSATASQRTRS